MADVSVRSLLLDLMNQLKDEHNLTYLFITHDLAVVKNISHRVAVMYLGKIVESAATGALFNEPLHPYTEALMGAIPVPAVGARKARVVIEGDLPNPIAPPSGCQARPSVSPTS